jgi:hypothetical protein
MLSTVHDSTTVSIATPMSTPSRCGGILGREMPESREMRPSPAKGRQLVSNLAWAARLS